VSTLKVNTLKFVNINIFLNRINQVLQDAYASSGNVFIHKGVIVI